MIALLRALAVLGVPVMSHLAVIFQLPALRVVAVLLLVVMLLANHLRKPLTWLAIAAIAVLLIVVPGIAIFITRCFPVILLAIFGGMFARSLMADRTALVAAVAAVVRQEQLPAKIARYCRAATWYWAIALLGMALVNLLLAVFASSEVWSAFANIGNYLIVALLFVLEFMARYVFLREFDHPSPREFFNAVRRLNYRELMG